VFTNFYDKYGSPVAPPKVNDWNGDGKPDYWYFGEAPDSGQSKVFIYLNQAVGDWDWDHPISFPVRRWGFNFQGDYDVADIDSDGDNDLIFYNYEFNPVNNQGSWMLTIYRNDRNGTFTALQTTPWFPTSAYARHWMDVNGDGQLDFVAKMPPGSSSTFSFQFSILSADGSMSAFTPITPQLDGLLTNVFGDFDGDGRVDVGTRYVAASVAKIGLWRNNGNSSFTAWPTFDAMPDESFRAVADMNSDGKDDILVYRYVSISPSYDRRLFLLKSNGDGTFSRSELPVFHPPDVSYFSSQIRIADFNGDGNPDVFEIGETFYSVHINDGSGNFTRLDYLHSFQDVDLDSIVDLDGDNKADVLMPIYTNIFDNKVLTVLQNSRAADGQTRSVDFDGNGRPDIATWNPASGGWTIVDGFGDNVQAATRSYWGSGSLGDIPVAGDFDGDGRSDYAVYRNSTGVWYILRSSNSTWMAGQFGVTGDIPAVADYDGGGLSDVAVFRPSDGNWYFLFTETGSFAFAHWGVSGDKPIAADYDGDGKADIAVYRPNEGNWYYLRSSDGGYRIVRWGIGTDIPVPGDYDGDGSSDIAVFRGGDWYILGSLEGGVKTFQWGLPGDIPVAFPQNGASDQPAVFRPSTGAWYSLIDLYGRYSSIVIPGIAGELPIYRGSTAY
jgi:hypothetical protein